jgi:hypothetical protein
LLLAAPVMRGGYRHVALIALELLGLAVLLALWARFAFAWRTPQASMTRQPLLVPLLMSPLLLALVQLMPLPAAWWAGLPGHAVYAETLEATGIAAGGWRPLSVSPDATTASLLAAIPLVATFLLGYFATARQLRTLLLSVSIVAFGEVALGLLQVSGGEHSPFFFGVLSFGPPIGTFTNRNHYANYLAMALAGYIWLAYESMHVARRATDVRPWQGSFSNRHATALWVAGGLVLVLGILLSRSRGAALFGLPMAGLGLAVVALRTLGRARGWRFAAAISAVLVLAAATLIGFDNVTSRLSGSQLASSASFRGELAQTSLRGALAFWPWGSGWGTYDLAYQRFQPPSIAGYANHAHQDYVQMLFEGGFLFVLTAGGVVWLAARRAQLLVHMARRDRTLDREAMAATLCGLGLLGLLLHSLVEFNMRIPANAILGALLAGAYLRPLSLEARTHDRPAQPHPPRHRRRRSKPRGLAGDGADRGR